MAKPIYPKNQPEVASILTRIYGDFAHNNKRNPLDELIFILCSVKTAEHGYSRTYSALRDEFPTFSRLAEAPPDAMAEPLRPGGLYRQKAKGFRDVFDAIIARFGKLSLSDLRRFDDPSCEAFLTTLRGVGLKVARCVMMYSLDREVFPVDTHCWRIARRLGWVRRTTKDGHVSNRDMDRLQAKIAPSLRFSLHVNFISLGREFCRAAAPRCATCPIAAHCPKIGVGG